MQLAEVASTEGTWTSLFDASVLFTSAPNRLLLIRRGFIERRTICRHKSLCKWLPSFSWLDGLRGPKSINVNDGVEHSDAKKFLPQAGG